MDLNDRLTKTVGENMEICR